MYILNHVLFFKFDILYLCIGSKTSVIFLCNYPSLPKLKILIINMYFKPWIIFKFLFYVSALGKNFCNILLYLSFVKDLPTDGHMSGRNL
jgi:hypothetical protein